MFRSAEGAVPRILVMGGAGSAAIDTLNQHLAYLGLAVVSWEDVDTPKANQDGVVGAVVVTPLDPFEERLLIAACASRIGSVPFVVLSPANDARRAVFALKHGASDFFTMDSDWMAVGGLAEYLGSLVREAAERGRAPSGPAAPTHILSARERECLGWSALGLTTDVIAFKLCISGRTVRFHLTNAMSKLRASNRSHAIARALQMGLIQLPQ
ncbi:helix-turn-helix transcriptional regulator [Magnetospirillum molischianum]|uniref:helix-turn-helix transcriptional regulator n=1 Tax=Magnetospirillum molischianum TaxID=1083 RepID=UPI00138ADE6D|nr:LuxR C-terminal-related transcriptional regulator [Magnetospirillum molischianum]